MISRLIWLVSVVTSVLVLLGFAGFAADQAKNASEHERAQLDQVDVPNPPRQTERVRERKHSKPRELIDDANDVLLAPFSSIVDSDEVWTNRLVPTALALLVYGFGLGFLARFWRGRA